MKQSNTTSNQSPIIEMFGNCYDSPLVDLIPLANIPVSYESDADHVHDGVHTCGDPDCPCATYGYSEG